MHRVSFPATLDTTVHGVSPAKPGNSDRCQTDWLACAASRGRPLHIGRGSSQPCHICRLDDAGTPQKGLSGGSNGGTEYLDQAQYNAACIMRHLALDNDAAHRKAAHAAVPALVALMKVSCPLGPALGCTHRTLSDAPCDISCGHRLSECTDGRNLCMDASRDH